MGNPSFLDFHIPVSVSTKIANPIKNNIPEIGKKKEPTTANICMIDFCIEDKRMANCIFIRVLR
jgi:hypothetical protein